MARKAASKVVSTLWEKAKWTGFESIRLNEQEKKEVKKMQLPAEEVLLNLQDMAAAGYKVSLSYSIPEDVYTLSLTGQYVEKPNAGLTASLRHRDPDTLFKAMIWAVGMDGYGIDWEERFGKVDNDNW